MLRTKSRYWYVLLLVLTLALPIAAQDKDKKDKYNNKKNKKNKKKTGIAEKKKETDKPTVKSLLNKKGGLLVPPSKGKKANKKESEDSDWASSTSDSENTDTDWDDGADTERVALIEENARLRALVVQLSTLVLRNVVDQHNASPLMPFRRPRLD